MVSRRRFPYGVTKKDLKVFVEGSDVVREFLNKYRGKRSTFAAYGRALCMFFSWLKIRRDIHYEPEEFLNEHLRRRGSLKVEDRRWALKLVLEFTRDNPDFAENGDSVKRLMFTAIRQFFSYYEADLTSSRAVYGRKVKRKYKPKPFSIEQVKRILGTLKQRERTICLIQLQSGQGIGEVLNKFNFMLDYIQGCIKAGSERIRLDFDERKGNGFNYFSFISRDAIQELEKWLFIRQKILDKLETKSNAIFITRSGQPYKTDNFQTRFAEQVEKAGLRKGPYSITSHGFRKLFKTESRPPERGIDQDCIEFMMGHLSGIESIGGVYDKTPELHASVIEREYAKLEPYINIYSGKTAETEGLGINPEDVETLKQVLQMVKQGKIKISL